MRDGRSKVRGCSKVRGARSRFSESEIAYIGMFGTAANALGAFMYKGCLRQVPLRILFGTLITFGALVASSQLVLIWGLNTQWNLPDFWCAIGDD